MKNIILFFAAIAISHHVFSQLPQLKWWFDIDDSSFGQSVAADIDNDGKLELIFGCYRNDSMVYALNAEDGSLLWKYNTHPANFEGCNDVAPIVYDVDNNDTLDVIVPSSCNPTTFCFHGATGKVIWESPTRGSDSPPTIADIDKDGKMEILHGEFGGYVICLNIEDGSKAWEIPVDLNSWIQTAPTIVDLDGDTYPDFVVATWNAVNKDSNKVYGFRGYDQKLLWTYPLTDVVYHGTAVADLDHDNKPELVIGDYSGRVTAINGEDGSKAWEYVCPEYFYAASPVSIADVDHDGHCEVLFSAWYKVYALTHDGQFKWDYDIPDFGGSFRGMALSDIDNDAKVDAVFGTSKGDVIALKGSNGKLIWKLDLENHYGDTLKFDHAPLVADFDEDGILDVFIVGGFTNYPAFGSNYGRAYAISASKGAGPDWLMFQHDIHRRSSLCAASTGIENEVPLKKSDMMLYPNPSKGEFVIRISGKEEGSLLLSIFNMQTEKVYERKFTDIHGQSEIPISSLQVSDGIYFARITSSIKTETVRMFIIN
ncbi:MAG: VCBS repeat-containing protein [Bacteroidetes bacterium]|nr:VCBS repeat-containing protein [Bacteroidota bacterium]